MDMVIKKSNIKFIIVCGLIGTFMLMLWLIQFKPPIPLYKNATSIKNEAKDHNKNISIQQDKIVLDFYKKSVITSQEYPQLFDTFHYKDTPQFYTTSLINYSTPKTDLTGSGQMIQIDRIVWVPASFAKSSSLLYDLNTGEYLISPKEQAFGRFPDTDIILTSPLTIRFRYDVSQPVFCIGYDCRGYWEVFYEWDSNKKKFLEVNNKYASYYKNLLKEYQNLNLNGCDLHYIYDIEGSGVKTLDAVYQSSKTNYCKGSTREDLSRFMEYKTKLENIIN